MATVGEVLSATRERLEEVALMCGMTASGVIEFGVEAASLGGLVSAAKGATASVAGAVFVAGMAADRLRSAAVVCTCP